MYSLLQTSFFYPISLSASLLLPLFQPSVHAAQGSLVVAVILVSHLISRMVLVIKRTSCEFNESIQDIICFVGTDTAALRKVKGHGFVEVV